MHYLHDPHFDRCARCTAQSADSSTTSPRRLCCLLVLRVSECTPRYYEYPWSVVYPEKLTVPSGSEDISRLLWSPKLRYRLQNSPLPASVLNNMNLIHILQFFFLRSSLILSVHLRLDLPSDLVPSGLPTKILCCFRFFLTQVLLLFYSLNNFNCF
jgi:hypothetical protein